MITLTRHNLVLRLFCTHWRCLDIVFRLQNTKTFTEK